MSRRAMMGAVGVAALLVGCSESSDVATGPRYGTSAPTTSSCNITQTKADARAYFPNSVQTTVQALIKTLGDQFTAGNTAGATNTGFDIMTYIANAHRNGTAVGTAQDGSNLTNDLLGCMAVGVIPPTPIDFTGALGSLGGYEVRGGSADGTGPVGALGKKSALQAPALVSWSTWVGGRVLFYGAPISNAFVTEAPVGTRGYNWSTIPVRHTLNGSGLVGVCVAATNRDRLQKKDEVGIGILTVQDILPLVTAGVLDCTTPLASAAPRGLLPRLAGLALSFVTPQAAYAAALGGGTGGTLNGLSDIGVLDAGQVNLTMSFISDATTTTALAPFTVTAKGNGGTVLPDVTIHLLVSGNSGSFTPISPTAVTDANGVATFTGVLLDKAGGYTLEATSDFTGYTQSAVFSNLFHIKQ
ncbi:MAG: hypothetical protein ACM3OH_06675 [Bacillota bacterium]